MRSLTTQANGPSGMSPSVVETCTPYPASSSTTRISSAMCTSSSSTRSERIGRGSAGPRSVATFAVAKPLRDRWVRHVHWSPPGLEAWRTNVQNGVPDHPLDPVAVASAERQMLPPPEDKRMRQLLEALCDATRVKIVRALRDDNTMAAGDLAHVIGRSRSATSQHLKVLRDLGVVSA